MKRSLIPWLCCPKCGKTLSLLEAHESHNEVESGTLGCVGCEARYPIARFIPRFVPADNYTSSFGFEWNRFQRTQLDSYTGTTISRDRFLGQTGWVPEALAGSMVLDIGCGAGRFVEVALSLGAQVFAIDYSNAVDACWRNFSYHPNLHLLQADMYALPFQPESFDFVYCIGVLQSTPDPRKAILAFPAQLKPGGSLAVDTYLRRWPQRFHPKSWLRLLTTRLSHETLLRVIERSVPFLLPISRIAGRIPGAGPILRRLVPVANYEGIYPLNEQQLYEWSVLDTFDGLSPIYDHPTTPQILGSWLIEARLEEVQVVNIGLAARGRKPPSR